MNPFAKMYLGDSVYVEVDRGMLKLTTENGYGPNNEIFLEVDVWNQLLTYVDNIKAAMKAAGERELSAPSTEGPEERK